MRYHVSEGDSAIALGSGDVPVLATPRLIAWMEAATVDSAMVFLAAGETTVGTKIRIEHRRATPVGGSVQVTATPISDVGDRRLTFAVAAIDDSGHVLAEGEIVRAIVDRDRFLRAAADAGPQTDHSRARLAALTALKGLPRGELTPRRPRPSPASGVGAATSSTIGQQRSASPPTVGHTATRTRLLDANPAGS